MKRIRKVSITYFLALAIVVIFTLPTRAFAVDNGESISINLGEARELTDTRSLFEPAVTFTTSDSAIVSVSSTSRDIDTSTSSWSCIYTTTITGKKAGTATISEVDANGVTVKKYNVKVNEYNFSSCPGKSFSVVITSSVNQNYSFSVAEGVSVSSRLRSTSSTTINNRTTYYKTYDLMIEEEGTWTLKALGAVNSVTSTGVVFIGHKSDDKYTVDMKPTCVKEGSKSYHCVECDSVIKGTEVVMPIDGTNHEGETEVRNASVVTCDTNGYTGDIYCKPCGTKIKEGTEIIKTGHHYSNPVFNWSEDGKSCTVTYTCTKDKSHRVTYRCTVTSAVKKKATCSTKGTTTYTAIYGSGETKITDTKDVQDIAIDSTNHEDETEVRNALVATCDTNGYTGDIYCKPCGTKIKEGTEIIKTGHHYSNPVFNWSEDGKSCTVTYTCTKDKSHRVTYRCTVTSAVKKKATCSTKGTTTYTATYGSGGTKVTDTKDLQDIAINSTNHTEKIRTTKATTKADGKSEKYCSACNKVISTTVIKKIKSVTLKYTATTYTGKSLTPSVVVKDSAGKIISSSNYTVKYTNNKNVGNATVTITFKGNYSGSTRLTFNINPKSTTISKVVSGSKRLKVNVKKQATQTSGYEVQAATDKKFTKNVKKGTITKNSTTSIELKSLKGNKPYYVRVRTYKVVNGKKYCSSWNVYSKTVKTKK